MSVSSEIKKANGLVSHSHKLIQLSWKPPKISKTPKNVARMKIKVQNFFALTFLISLCNPIFTLLSEKWPTNVKHGQNWSGTRIQSSFDWDWTSGLGYFSRDGEVRKALTVVKNDGTSKNRIRNIVEQKWYKITILKYHWSCIDHSWRQMDYTFGSSRDKNMDWKIRISKSNFQNSKQLKIIKKT